MNRNIMSVVLTAVVLAALCGSTALTRNSATATMGTAALAKNLRDRCATRHIDETTATQYEQAMNKFNSKRSPGQIRKSGSVTIQVYFHVVNKGSGIEMATAG